MNVLRSVADLLVAKSCFYCGASSSKPLCDACQNLLPFLSVPFCHTCGYPTMDQVNVCRQCRGKRLYFKQGRSLLAYEGNARKILLSIKMQSSYSLVDYFIKRAIGEIEDQFFEVDAVTFIPETFLKKVRKKHNSSELIARVISHYTKAPLLNTLKITKNIADQAALTLKERQDNLKGAFTNKNVMNGFRGTMLVVDDVYTTGATANEASRALSGKGIKIKVFSLARTL